MSGELDGIAKQVGHDLDQALTVCDQIARSVAGNLEPDLAGGGKCVKLAHGFAGDVREPRGRHAHVHASGFQLGQVEQVVKQDQQTIATVGDMREILLHLVGRHRAGPLLSEAREGEDAVHRRPQFM